MDSSSFHEDNRKNKAKAIFGDNDQLSSNYRFNNLLQTPDKYKYHHTTVPVLENKAIAKNLKDSQRKKQASPSKNE